MKYDVAIVGGGPAGLAVAIGAAQQGLSTIVLERSKELPDKACGEGVMPPGLGALDRLGVLPYVSAWSPIEGIRYVQERGRSAEGKLPGAGGRGIRRTHLIEAFARRAREVGVDLRLHAGVRRHAISSDSVTLETEHERIDAQILIAADGLASPLRHAAGLDRTSPQGRLRRGLRYGLRRHFSRAPWTSFVEVHLSPGCEAYVTPSSPTQVGLAFLWEDGAIEPSWDAFMLRFPSLAARLENAEPTSSARGAGPLKRGAHAIAAPRLALAGDAAGYIDAITGEGLSVSLVCAEALIACLPEAIRQRGDPRAFDPYARTFAKVFARYRWSTEALLFLARRPALRRPTVDFLSRNPRLFEAVLSFVVG
mgnify:CR=1 FL=1